MSTVVAESRPVEPLSLQMNPSPAATPVGTPDDQADGVSPLPTKMKKPAKMKKAPRRQSVALAQASPSMLEEEDAGALGAMVQSDLGSSSGGAAAMTPRTMQKMKKPQKIKKPYVARNSWLV